MNAKLRDEGKDLNDPVTAWEIDRTELEAHMAEKGFSYYAELRQSR